MLITRHGGEAHVVRPDGVYRTSVLQSIFGYHPGADAQAVAQAFTQGPPNAMVVSNDSQPLAGLGGGPLSRFAARVKAAWNAGKARKFMALNGPTGPAYTEAQIISPQIHGMQQRMMTLNNGNGPEQAMFAASERGFRRY